MGHNLCKYINDDLLRYKRIEGVTPRSPYKARLRLLFFSYGLHAVIIYRFGKFVKTNRIFNIVFPLKSLLLFIYHLFKAIIKIFYGIDISPRADIDRGFYIGHFGNIFIGDCVVIGKNCTVNQQTRIGGKTYTDNKETRISIGNNVWIGAHVEINKSVVIGSNATISGGSVIIYNVMENSLVMGNPARVIALKYDNSRLL